MWLQLALLEAAHRALIVSHNLQAGIRHLARIRDQAFGGRSTTTTLDGLDDDVDEEPWREEPGPDGDGLDEARQILRMRSDTCASRLSFPLGSSRPATSRPGRSRRSMIQR